MQLSDEELDALAPYAGSLVILFELDDEYVMLSSSMHGRIVILSLYTYTLLTRDHSEGLLGADRVIPVNDMLGVELLARMRDNLESEVGQSYLREVITAWKETHGRELDL